MTNSYQLQENSIGILTSSVQFGFIFGTFIFALFTIVDLFSPSKVFFLSAVLGALCNLGLLYSQHDLYSLVTIRFFTGFFLAGIYPVGMKIATDYYNEGLGKSLGFLVGALVLGTALPHLLNGVFISYSWKNILFITSFLSFLGGLLIIVFVKNGPYRKQSENLNISAFLTVFHKKNFKQAAFGYFGHMWELYTFWTFVPLLLLTHKKLNSNMDINISLLSFVIIAAGTLSCICGGYVSEKLSIRKTAFAFLLLSCLCCLLAPFMVASANTYIFISFLVIWGMVVIADSPLFSTLVAQNAPKQDKGTALTIVNCVGFTITIVSIQLFSSLLKITNSYFIYMFLAIGPIFGLFALTNKTKKEKA